MIASTHDALHDQSNPHGKEKPKMLRNPHLFLHRTFQLYRSVINQFPAEQTKLILMPAYNDIHYKAEPPL